MIKIKLGTVFLRLASPKKASVTIEAALIMPLLLASLFFVIQMSLFAHDRCMLLKAGLDAALRAETGYIGEDAPADLREEAYAMADNVSGEIVRKKMTVPWDIEKDISMNENEIRIELKGRTAFMGGMAGFYPGASQFTGSARVSAGGDMERPSEFIREMRKRSAVIATE